MSYEELRNRANTAIYLNGEYRADIETYRQVIAEWKKRAEVAENTYLHTPVGHIIERLQNELKKKKKLV